MEVAEKEEGAEPCLLPPLSCFSVPLCLCGRFLSLIGDGRWEDVVDARPSPGMAGPGGIAGGA